MWFYVFCEKGGDHSRKAGRVTNEEEKEEGGGDEGEERTAQGRGGTRPVFGWTLEGETFDSEEPSRKRTVRGETQVMVLAYAFVV